MTDHRLRLALFLPGAALMALLFVLACAHLPGPDAVRSRYMQAVNTTTVTLRHVTDAVTAVNFDYRGFDTLGEEFILFISVGGTLVLLREQEDRGGSKAPDAVVPGRSNGPSDALRAWTLAMTGPTVLFGLYMVLHGQVSPGGGFQGGVILATAPLLIYIAESYDVFRRITSHRWVEFAEALGAAGYAVVGLIAFLHARTFLTNVLPLGPGGTNVNVMSGGTVALIDIAVGLEVAAGFVLLLRVFLADMLEVEGE